MRGRRYPRFPLPSLRVNHTSLSLLLAKFAAQAPCRSVPGWLLSPLDQRHEDAYTSTVVKTQNPIQSSGWPVRTFKEASYAGDSAH